MTSEQTPSTCGHAQCSCAVPDGALYCSEACRKVAEHAAGSESVSHADGCACGHPGCTRISAPR